MAETVAPNDYHLLFSAFPNVFPSLTYQYLGFTPDLNETRDTDTLPKAENRARPRRLANSTARRDTTQDPKALAARTPVLLPEKAGHRAVHSEWPRRPHAGTRHSSRRRWPLGHRKCFRGRHKIGPTSTKGNDTVPVGAGRSDTESASDEDTKSGRPHRWTTYNTTRTARSVLGSPACVETPSPDRAQRPGADLHEHRSEELPLLRKQGPGPHVASWGADLDENHSEELLSRYQAKTVQWTVFGF